MSSCVVERYSKCYQNSNNIDFDQNRCKLIERKVNGHDLWKFYCNFMGSEYLAIFELVKSINKVNPNLISRTNQKMLKWMKSKQFNFNSTFITVGLKTMIDKLSENIIQKILLIPYSTNEVVKIRKLYGFIEYSGRNSYYHLLRNIYYLLPNYQSMIRNYLIEKSNQHRILERDIRSTLKKVIDRKSHNFIYDLIESKIKLSERRNLIKFTIQKYFVDQKINTDVYFNLKYNKHGSIFYYYLIIQIEIVKDPQNFIKNINVITFQDQYDPNYLFIIRQFNIDFPDKFHQLLEEEIKTFNKLNPTTKNHILTQIKIKLKE